MTECEPHSPPAEQSAFSFAIRAFHHELVDHLSNTHVPIPANFVSDHEPSEVPTPFQANDLIIERTNSNLSGAPDATDTRADAFAKPTSCYATHSKLRRSPVITMRHTQVKTMLLRCQVLQETILSLERKHETSNNNASVQHHYDTMRDLAYRACVLSQGLHDYNLLARSEWWTGHAIAGINDQIQAMRHREAVRMPGQACLDNQDGNKGSGLAAREKQENDAPLQRVLQRSPRDGVQRRYSPASRRDSLLPEHPPTIKDELDAKFECLDHEDDYGDLFDYLEDGEPLDPRGWLSRAQQDQ